jgi:hypothetical protein
MSESHSEGPQIEVQSDENWKERVKEEDRLRDEQAAGRPAATSSEDEDPFVKLPRVDFSILVQMFAAQAMTAMGFIAAPGSEKPVQRLPLARHFIDLLGVLEEKSRGNLTPREEQLLSSTLHDLRLAYVELSRSRGSSPGGGDA